MIRRNLIMHCSLFAGMLGILAGGDVCAAVRVGNTSRAIRNNQQISMGSINMVPANGVTQMAGNVESQIKTNDDAVEAADAARQAACSAIYPNGTFTIARPTAGSDVGAAKTCVAVVELRGYQMGLGGSDAVLARANVAAGSVLDCNISAFPEASYTMDAMNVVFPADKEPTVQDVIKVMNQEQKQNAGLKIAAGALIGAVGGNLSGKNDVGKDGLFGASNSQLVNTAIGAVGGAAIGAGGAYAGKVGGDMIASAGMNAVAGGVVGNIVASGNQVLRIEKCKISETQEDSCLWGYLVSGADLKPQPNKTDVLCRSDRQNECAKYLIDLDDGKTVMRCTENNTNCMVVTDLVSIIPQGSSKTLDRMEGKDFIALKGVNSYEITKEVDGNRKMIQGSGSDTSHAYAIIESAKVAEGPQKPVMMAGINDSAFGRDREYWYTLRGELQKNNDGKHVIYYRNALGNADGVVAEADALNNFYPMYVDAEDGDIIDLGNKARLKSTLIGAGAGGALGAFTAYQGAQSDIDERWVSAVREYKDSLQKFYCITGSRFLSYYNDPVIIPDVNE